LIVVIVFNLAFFIGCQNNSTKKNLPKAINGVLDLNNWDLKKDGPVEIAGEWEFYWEKHLNPEDFAKSIPPEKTGFMSIPGCWNGYLLKGKQLSGDGYATYRLKILMNDQKGSFAIKLHDIHTAFILYVNGKKISFAGNAGKTFETTIPYIFPTVSDFTSETNQVEIILQISNFHHRLGGQYGVLQLGREKEILKIRERNIIFDIFLCGSILLMGIYHLSIYSLRTKDRSPLYFGIFCFLIVLRILTTGEKYFIHLFPGIDWELTVKIEYLSFYLAVSMFATFIHSLFPGEFPKRVIRIIQFFGIIFSCIVLLTPAKIYSHTVQPYLIITFMSCFYGIYGLILSLVRRKKGAFLLFLGFLVLFLTVAIDILSYSGIITNVGSLAPLGVFFFIFFKAFLLSRRFSMAFKTVEKQSQDLRETNIACLQEINERKQTEKALQESEDRFKLIFDYAPDGYYLIDFEGRFLDGNIMAEKISGYNKKELIGKGFHEIDLLSSNELTKAIDVLIQCTQGLTSGPTELTLKKKDGDTVEIEITVYPIKIKDQDVILGIARDVTEKKKLELQFGQAQKMKAIGTLAGGIAHDFNNLLMAISGYNSLIRLKTDTSHPNYKHLDGVMQCVESASGLTKQLLGFARGGKYEVRPTDLNEFVKAQNRMFSHTKKEITIHSK
ncbi:MAG: PAS domain S-box protein, partial [Desulfobacterales bacterium]|nr:PAS domain S-box protein [Desulfobacterales bacterium]